MKRDDLLDLNDALQHPGRIVEVDLTTDLPEEADLDLVTPLTGYLQAQSTGNRLFIKGEFSAKCIVECARCSNPIEHDLFYVMEEDFPVEGTPKMYGTDDFARIAADEEPYPLFEDNSLMVENLIRQGLWINMPVAPLCEHGWEGDCPLAKGMDEIRSRGETEHPLAGLQALRDPEESS